MPDNRPSRWYETWFDSPHYHRLYGHRSDAEAAAFIRNLHDHHGWNALRLLDGVRERACMLPPQPAWDTTSSA